MRGTYEIKVSNVNVSFTLELEPFKIMIFSSLTHWSNFRVHFLGYTIAISNNLPSPSGVAFVSPPEEGLSCFFCFVSDRRMVWMDTSWRRNC